MYYVITVSSIISILNLSLAVYLYKRGVAYRKRIVDLQNQLSELEPVTDGPRLQTLMEKIAMARETLVPKIRWKAGMTPEQVAYDEGALYALAWLEQNHSRVKLSSRQVRT